MAKGDQAGGFAKRMGGLGQAMGGVGQAFGMKQPMGQPTPMPNRMGGQDLGIGPSPQGPVDPGFNMNRGGFGGGDIWGRLGTQGPGAPRTPSGELDLGGGRTPEWGQNYKMGGGFGGGMFNPSGSFEQMMGGNRLGQIGNQMFGGQGQEGAPPAYGQQQAPQGFGGRGIFGAMGGGRRRFGF